MSLELLFDEKDIESIYTITTNKKKEYIYNFNPATTVIKKIRLTRDNPKIRKSHIINIDEFKTIYAISDIHADYSNFINYLFNLGLITLPRKNIASGGGGGGSHPCGRTRYYHCRRRRQG